MLAWISSLFAPSVCTQGSIVSEVHTQWLYDTHSVGCTSKFLSTESTHEKPPTHILSNGTSEQVHKCAQTAILQLSQEEIFIKVKSFILKWNWNIKKK